jgi:hypothetical protein
VGDIPPFPGNVKDEAKYQALLNSEFTAEAVKGYGRSCPKVLCDLGKQIAAHLEKARKCEEKAEQHYTTIGQRLVQVQDLCDDGGFHAVREKFFPDLGRSRTYEILQIATGKKSIEGIRAGTRERIRRHRARQNLSVTVTDAAPVTGGENPPPLSDDVDDCVAAVRRRIESAVVEIETQHRYKDKSRQKFERLFAAVADTIADLECKLLSRIEDNTDASAVERKAHHVAIKGSAPQDLNIPDFLLRSKEGASHE